MNILVLSPFLPYPDAPAGSPRAVFDRLRLLSGRHHITLATFSQPGEARHAQGLRKLGIEVYLVPHDPSSERAGPALWKKRARLAVGLLAGRYPMLVQEFGSADMRRLVQGLLRKRHPDVVLVEHILAAQYVEDSAGIPRVVLSEYDPRLAASGVHDVAGGAGPLNRLRRLFEAIDRLRWKRYAERAYRSAEVVTAPTDEDAASITRIAPGVKVEVVPLGILGIPDTFSVAESVHKRETDSLLFVGNFDHPPNVDAARRLCREILPLVWASRPSTRLWLVGKNPTSEVRALAGERVTVTGEVPSVAPYLHSCALFVAPIHEGGGMRIKLIEALAAGAPVVTTPLGAQGLGAVPGKHLLVAGGTASFAEAVLRALEDRDLREALGAAGRELVCSERAARERLERLEAVLRV